MEPDYCGSLALAAAAECNSASRILTQDGWCYSSSAELQPPRRSSLLRYYRSGCDCFLACNLLASTQGVKAVGASPGLSFPQSSLAYSCRAPENPCLHTPYAGSPRPSASAGAQLVRPAHAAASVSEPGDTLQAHGRYSGRHRIQFPTTAGSRPFPAPIPNQSRCRSSTRRTGRAYSPTSSLTPTSSRKRAYTSTRHSRRDRNRHPTPHRATTHSPARARHTNCRSHPDRSMPGSGPHPGSMALPSDLLPLPSMPGRGLNSMHPRNSARSIQRECSGSDRPHSV